jgi:hypothetical protein
MKSITARVINEIFINNLIKISVSYHAGTSSLTYAYGTPNHIVNLFSQYKIPFKLGGNDNNDLENIVNQYYNGNVDNLTSNESTEPPDNKALEGTEAFNQNYQPRLSIFQTRAKNSNTRLEK